MVNDSNAIDYGNHRAVSTSVADLRLCEVNQVIEATINYTATIVVSPLYSLLYAIEFSLGMSFMRNVNIMSSLEILLSSYSHSQRPVNTACEDNYDTIFRILNPRCPAQALVK